MKNFKEHRPASFEKRGNWIHNWFSNMIPCVLLIDGVAYASVENYYQAMKTLNKDQQAIIATASPSDSKRLGRRVDMRPDWEEIKYDVMKRALRVKFEKPEWYSALAASYPDMIIEWNNWDDKIWGVSVLDNMGQNLLGQALMELRQEFKDDHDLSAAEIAMEQ